MELVEGNVKWRLGLEYDNDFLSLSFVNKKKNEVW